MTSQIQISPTESKWFYSTKLYKRSLRWVREGRREKLGNRRAIAMQNYSGQPRKPRIVEIQDVYVDESFYYQMSKFHDHENPTNLPGLIISKDEELIDNVINNRVVSQPPRNNIRKLTDIYYFALRKFHFNAAIYAPYLQRILKAFNRTLTDVVLRNSTEAFITSYYIEEFGNIWDILEGTNLNLDYLEVYLRHEFYKEKEAPVNNNPFITVKTAKLDFRRGGALFAWQFYQGIGGLEKVVGNDIANFRYFLSFNNLSHEWTQAREPDSGRTCLIKLRTCQK